jgi:hypothetical protein
VSTTEWHADTADVAAYLSGRAPRAVAASLEAHLLHCSRCREQVALGTRDDETEAAWERLADAVDRPSPSVVRRIAGGRGWARSVAATPLMVQAAATAVLLVGVVPLVTALATGSGGLVTLLLLAPLAPMAAVVVSYRQAADPAGEMSLATASAGLRLVAARSLVVAAVALPLALGVLLVVDRVVQDVPAALAVGWCLPGLAMAALVLLAGTTRFDPVYVAAGLAVGWALTVGAVVSVHRSLRPELLADVLASPGAQVAALAVATAALLLTVARRDTVAYRRNS